MPSHKVVFFLTPNAAASQFVKRLFQRKYGMPKGIENGLVFDYISHKITGTSLDLKVYLVPDLEKHEKLRSLYFKNVDTFVVVFDGAAWSTAWRTGKKICEDLQLHQSNSKIVFLFYKKDVDFIRSQFFSITTKFPKIFLEFTADHGKIIEFLDQAECLT